MSFRAIENPIDSGFRHLENRFNDFDREPNLKSIIRKNFPSLLVLRHDQSLFRGIDRKNTILNQSKKFKLIVETIESTGFVEAMFYNISVVLLLDRSFINLDRSNVKKIKYSH